ncbi:hypothetical protein CIHG_06006 [Coccidioides immitis H538.4]|uniref:Uncharacterized protein n=1 Tax=Coccidioides immitis H538.4 TaxID=396776 RepID=A0A0J8RUB1_COCIT|nr:hypothetical protein CIHG_06006 [Coccidioides immitis H538.4]
MVHARRKTTQRRVGEAGYGAVAHTYVQPRSCMPAGPSDQRVDVISVVCAGTYIMETLAFPAQKPSSLPDQGSFPAVC